MATTQATVFNSDGFDLDAASISNTDGTVFEIGGGATTTTVPAPPASSDAAEKGGGVPPSRLTASEEIKAEGNQLFKNGLYLDAIDTYTDAIEKLTKKTPDDDDDDGAMKGEDILTLRNEHEEKEQKAAYKRAERKRQQEGERRNRKNSSSETQDMDENTVDNDELSTKVDEFKVPDHPYNNKLSVYYCNRAACLLHLERYDEAINDCDIAILLNPMYVKAYIRRSMAHEKNDDEGAHTDLALADVKKAHSIDPSNLSVRKSITRLEKIEKERMDKLKDETMGKLKDLGNSLLGNFGLSLDNFKSTQDPNTGSYSIAFDNNANKE